MTNKRNVLSISKYTQQIKEICGKQEQFKVNQRNLHQSASKQKQNEAKECATNQYLTLTPATQPPKALFLIRIPV